MSGHIIIIMCNFVNGSTHSSKIVPRSGGCCLVLRGYCAVQCNPIFMHCGYLVTCFAFWIFKIKLANISSSSFCMLWKGLAASHIGMRSRRHSHCIQVHEMSSSIQDSGVPYPQLQHASLGCCQPSIGQALLCATCRPQLWQGFVRRTRPCA